MAVSLRRFGLFVAVVCLATCGCSNDQPADSGTADAAAGAGGETDGGPAAPSAVGAVADVAAAGGGGGTAADTSTPDGTVKAFFAALKDNKLDRIWNLLPARYQSDINSVVRDFGKGVDAEMWDGTFKTANRYFSITLAKQDMILKTPQAQEQMQNLTAGFAAKNRPINLSDPENFKKLSRPVYEAVITLLGSQLKTTKELQSFDVGKFLGGPVSEFLSKIRKVVDAALSEMKAGPKSPPTEVPAIAMLMEKFDDTMSSDVKVTVTSMEGDNATVSVTIGGIGNPLELSKVDGKWVPAEMAAGWDAQIKQIKGGVAFASLMVNSAKPRIMPQLEKINPLLDEMEKAKTQDAVNAAYAKLESAFMTPIAEATGFEGLAAGGGGGSVALATVVVPGRFDGKQTRGIIKALEAASDNPDEAITMVTPGSGETKFHLSPVDNFEGFQAKLTFGEVTESDPLKKEIHLKITGDPAAAAK